MQNNIKKPVGVDVVIISYAKTERLQKETEKTISTLFSSENPQEVVFNAIIVETNKKIDYKHIDTKGHELKTVYTEKEFGYHTYLNYGLTFRKHEWSCLCNNDLEFTKGWATNILLVSSHNKLIEASFSPANPNEKWHKENLNKIEVGYGVRQHVTGWCLFQHKSVLDKIGNLEERIKFWFCDNWYSVALQHNKIPHVYVGTSIVYHHDEIEGTTTAQVGLSKEEKHDITFGAGEEFRQVVREMLDDDSWGRPTEETKKELKRQGKTFY